MKYINKTKFYRLILALLLFVPLIAAGCSKKTITSQPVTLKIWKPFLDTDKMQPLIDAYRKAHPNVTIEYTKKNIENYETDLLNAFAEGRGPDIYSINNAWLPKYINKAAPAPENLWRFKDYKDSFVDVVSQDFTKDNKIYGTVLSVDSLALYYNKDILGTVGIATPPKTWDDLANQVRRITRQDQGGYFTRSGVAIGTNANVNRAGDILALFMLQAGVIPWSPDGLTPRFSETVRKNGETYSPGQDALDFYISFADPSSDNYTWNERSDYSIDAFANGRAAFLYSYAYATPLIKSKSPNLNFDIAPVPQEDLDNTSVNYANYFGEVVNKQSKNTEVAWDFLKFITSKESLEKYYVTNKQPSSRKDLIELQIQDQDIGIFAHANLTAKSFYKPDEAQMNAIFGRMIDNVNLRGMSISQALSEGQSQAAVLSRPR